MDRKEFKEFIQNSTNCEKTRSKIMLLYDYAPEAAVLVVKDHHPDDRIEELLLLYEDCAKLVMTESIRVNKYSIAELQVAFIAGALAVPNIYNTNTTVSKSTLEGVFLSWLKEFKKGKT